MPSSTPPPNGSPPKAEVSKTLRHKVDEVLSLIEGKQPQSRKLTIQFCASLLSNRQFLLAEEMLTTFFKHFTPDAQGLWALGFATLYTRGPHLADEFYKKAEKLAETNPGNLPSEKIYYLLSAEFGVQGRDNMAREVRQRILSMWPHSTFCHTYEIIDSLRHGDIDRAIDHARVIVLNAQVGKEKALGLRFLTLCQWAKKGFADMPGVLADHPWPDTGRPKLVLAEAVWGEAYIDIFEYHLRTLIAPGNLPSAAKHLDLRMVLVTTQNELNIMTKRGVLDCLTGIAEVIPIIMPTSLPQPDEYLTQSTVMYHLYSICMHMGLDYARHAQAGVTMLTADTIAADGAFGYMASLAAEGYHGIVGNGMIADLETMLPALDKVAPDKTKPIAISSQKLMELVRPRLHQLIKRAIVSPSNHDFDNPPAVLFWKSPEGLIGHGFNLQPYYVSGEALQNYQTYRLEAVDGWLMCQVFPDKSAWSQIAIMDDSNEFNISTLASAKKGPSTTGKPFDINREKTYIHNPERVTDYHLWLFQKKLYHRGVLEGTPPDEYQPDVVAEILDAINHAPPPFKPGIFKDD